MLGDTKVVNLTWLVEEDHNQLIRWILCSPYYVKLEKGVRLTHTRALAHLTGNGVPCRAKCEVERFCCP